MLAPQIYSYNGSAIVAMAGEQCVAIGSDLRFGVQMQTLATDYQKVLQVTDKLFVGLAGLASDQTTLYALPPACMRAHLCLWVRRTEAPEIEVQALRKPVLSPRWRLLPVEYACGRSADAMQTRTAAVRM